MIKVTATRENGKIINLTVIGHANSAPEGKDLVCAAVSSILVGGCNALSSPDCYAIKLNKGDAEIKQIKRVSQRDYEVLDIILIQLQTLEECNPDFIKISQKGK